MSIYEGYEHVRGATPAEAEILKVFKANKITEEANISKYIYNNFLIGKRVPLFIRERLQGFLLAKADELKRLAKGLNKN